MVRAGARPSGDPDPELDPGALAAVRGNLLNGVDEPCDDPSHGRIVQLSVTESPHAHGQLRFAGGRLDTCNLADDALHEEAVDAEQKIVDAVDRKLEPRGDSAEHERCDAPVPVARRKLDRGARRLARVGRIAHPRDRAACCASSSVS